MLSVLTATMLAFVAPVTAQTFPDKPIRVIVPFPADVQLRAALPARRAEPVAASSEALSQHVASEVER
jgi:hypothetical protein